MDEYDAFHAAQALEIDGIERSAEEPVQPVIPGSIHISVGSRMDPVSFDKIGVRSTTDPVFSAFRRKVSERLTLILNMDKPPTVQNHDEVCAALSG